MDPNSTGDKTTNDTKHNFLFRIGRIILPKVIFRHKEDNGLGSANSSGSPASNGLSKDNDSISERHVDGHSESSSSCEWDSKYSKGHSQGRASEYKAGQSTDSGNNAGSEYTSSSCRLESEANSGQREPDVTINTTCDATNSGHIESNTGRDISHGPNGKQLNGYDGTPEFNISLTRYSSEKRNETSAVVQEDDRLRLGSNKNSSNIRQIGEDKMGFTTEFKNLGHYFAVGAKYVATGLGDVIKFANKAQPIAPEVEALAGALGGPLGSKIADLAFNVLGSTAAALTSVQVDATAEAATTGVNLVLDLQTVNDIKAAAVQIDAILRAVGATKPATVKPVAK